MDTAFLIATSRCSRSCPFCFYSTGYLDYPSGEMDGTRIFAALERMAGMGVGKVIISGGEPLLRDDIEAIIRKAAEFKLERLLLTNGELLDEMTVRSLLDSKLEGITLSINTVEEAERLEKNSALLQRSPEINVTVATVFTGRNVADVPQLYRWATAMGWGIIFQPAFVPRESKEFEELSPHRLTESQWSVISPVLLDWGRCSRNESYVNYILSLYRGGGSRPSYCPMGTLAFVLDCDGAAYPCFHRKDLHAGDIVHSPPVAIERKMSSFARELRKAPCYGEHCVSLFCGL